MSKKKKRKLKKSRRRRLLKQKKRGTPVKTQRIGSDVSLMRILPKGG